MKLIGALIVLVVLVFPLSAQTAKVIALSPEDAAQIKSLYEQRDALNKKIEEATAKIADKYLMESKPGSDHYITCTESGTVSYGTNICFSLPRHVETAEEKKKHEEEYKKWREAEKKATHLERKQGWSSFEFSEDFKFIVPKNTLSVTTYSPCGCGGFGCITPANLGYGTVIAQ